MASKTFEFIISATERGVKKTFDAVSKGAGASVKSLRTFDRSMGVVDRTINDFTRNAGGALLKLTAIAGGLGFAFKRGLLDTAAQFEDFTATLTTIEGSSEKAKESMDWISDFAATTPFQLDQVTAAFVKLRAYGMDPSNGLLRTLGDTASAMGKDVMQAVEAIADAVTGENERLKEFGIKAQVEGNEIRYTYTDKAGQQLTKLVDKHNRAQIQSTLESIWNEKFAGAMDLRSKTWNGMVSNLMDQWTRFRQMLMDGGAFDYLKGKLDGILTTINEMADSGRLQELADLYGKKLTKALQTVWEMGVKTYDVLQRFGPALLVAAKVTAAVLAFNLLYSVVAATVTAVTGLGAAFYALTGSSILVWLASVRAALIALVTANPLLALATAAAFAAVQVGRLVTAIWEAKQANDALAQAQADQAANSAHLSDKIADGLAKATASTGIQITSMEQFNKLARDGVIIFDKQAQQWVAVAAAAEQSAAKQAQVQGQALEKMQAQYAKYVEEIKKYQDQIAGRERSLAEELRAMTRSVMDAGQAWKDQKAEAEEYEKAARKAAEAGDFAKAIELADKAKDKFKALNQEVKDGDQIMVSQKQALETAMGGVERSGQLAIDVLKKQETAARNAAEALTEQSGFQDLSAGIEGFEQVWATSWQHMQDVTGNAFAATEKKIFSFARQMDEATAAREITIDAKLTPEAKEILQKFKDLPGVTVSFPGYAGGTYLPGYGGGDRNPALLEDGEVVLNKETVRSVGPDWLLHLNALRGRARSMIRAQVGGLIDQARLTAVAPLRMQAGGLVAGGSQETVNINLTYPGASQPAPVTASRATARQIIADLERYRRLSS